MKIPKQIKISGYLYQVIFHNRENDDGIDHIGTCDNLRQKIWIETERPQSLQESTFFHEIIEAINYNYELNLSHQQISILETTLYQVFKDNHLLNED